MENIISALRDVASYCTQPYSLDGCAASTLLGEWYRQQSQGTGTMIVHQPDMPAPVLINFPLPAWATRAEGVDDQDLDKAAREFAEKF